MTFYVPCLATLGTMANEIGRKLTLAVAGYSLAMATGLGAATRLLLHR